MPRIKEGKTPVRQQQQQREPETTFVAQDVKQIVTKRPTRAAADDAKHRLSQLAAGIQPPPIPLPHQRYTTPSKSHWHGEAEGSAQRRRRCSKANSQPVPVTPQQQPCLTPSKATLHDERAPSTQRPKRACTSEPQPRPLQEQHQPRTPKQPSLHDPRAKSCERPKRSSTVQHDAPLQSCQHQQHSLPRKSSQCCPDTPVSVQGRKQQSTPQVQNRQQRTPKSTMPTSKHAEGIAGAASMVLMCSVPSVP